MPSFFGGKTTSSGKYATATSESGAGSRKTAKSTASFMGDAISSCITEDETACFFPRPSMLAGMTGMVGEHLLPDVNETGEERAKRSEIKDETMENLLHSLRKGCKAFWWREKGDKKDIWLNLSEDSMKLHFRSVTQKEKLDAAKKKLETNSAKMDAKHQQMELRYKQEEELGLSNKKDKPTFDVSLRTVPDKVKNCTIFIADFEDGEDGVYRIEPAEDGSWDPCTVSNAVWSSAKSSGVKPSHCLHIQYRDFISGREAELHLSFKKATMEVEPGVTESLTASQICTRWRNGLKCLQYGGYGDVSLPTAVDITMLNPMAVWLEKLWVYAAESGGSEINVKTEVPGVLTFCNVKQKRLVKLVADLLSSEPAYKQFDTCAIETQITEGRISIKRAHLQKLMWALRNHDLVNQMFAEYSRDRPKMRLRTEGTERGFEDYLREQDGERDLMAKQKLQEKELKTSFSNDQLTLKSKLRSLKEERDHLRKGVRERRDQTILMVQEHILKYYKSEISKAKFTTFLMHSVINTAFNPWATVEPEWAQYTPDSLELGVGVWGRPLKDFYIATSINSAYGIVSNIAPTTYLPYGCTKILTPREALSRTMSEFNPRAIHLCPRDKRVGRRSKGNWRVGTSGYPHDFPIEKKPVAVFDTDAPPPDNKEHPSHFYKPIREKGESLSEMLWIIKDNAFKFSPTPFILVVEVADGPNWVADHNSIAGVLKDVLGTVQHPGSCTCGTVGKAASHGTIITPNEMYETPAGAAKDGSARTAVKSVKEMGGVASLPLGLLYKRFIIAIKGVVTDAKASPWIPLTKRAVQTELSRIATLEIIPSCAPDRSEPYCKDVMSEKLCSHNPARNDACVKKPTAMSWPDSGDIHDNPHQHQRRQSVRERSMSVISAAQPTPRQLTRPNGEFMVCWTEDEIKSKLDKIDKWQFRQMREEIKDINESSEKSTTHGLHLPIDDAELPKKSDYINELHTWTRCHMTYVVAERETNDRIFGVGDKVKFTTNGEPGSGTIDKWKTQNEFLIKTSTEKLVSSKDCDTVTRPTADSIGKDRNQKWSNWKKHSAAESCTPLFDGVGNAFSAGVQMVGIDYLPNPHTRAGKDAIALRSLYRSKFRMSHKGSYGYLLKPTHLLSDPEDDTSGGSKSSNHDNKEATQEELDAGRRWRETGPCTFICKITSAQFLPSGPADGEKGESLLDALNPAAHIKKAFSKEDDQLAAIVDPYVEIRVDGVLEDCFAARTRSLQDNGYCPRWDDSWSIPITQKEHAVLTLTVYHDDGSDEGVFLARGSLPLVACRLGYRALFLYDENEKRLSTCPTITCHFREAVSGDPVQKAADIKRLERMRDETKHLVGVKQTQLLQLRESLRTSARQLAQIRKGHQKAKEINEKYSRSYCLMENCNCVLQ